MGRPDSHAIKLRESCSDEGETKCEAVGDTRKGGECGGGNALGGREGQLSRGNALDV